jgi:hypothetical protein
MVCEITINFFSLQRFPLLLQQSDIKPTLRAVCQMSCYSCRCGETMSLNCGQVIYEHGEPRSSDREGKSEELGGKPVTLPLNPP